MRCPWEKFTVVENQIQVEYILVLRRSHGVLVAEIGTKQKYAQLLGFSGCELHLTASGITPKDKYDPDAMATSVVFPRSLRGWSVVAESLGRYSLRIALYKPALISRLSTVTREDEAWRIAWLTHDKTQWA